MNYYTYYPIFFCLFSVQKYGWRGRWCECENNEEKSVWLWPLSQLQHWKKPVAHFQSKCCCFHCHGCRRFSASISRTRSWFEWLWSRFSGLQSLLRKVPRSSQGGWSRYQLWASLSKFSEKATSNNAEKPIPFWKRDKDNYKPLFFFFLLLFNNYQFLT